VPAPTYDPDVPLQALVTNLDASPYVGRLALCRVINGTLRKGQQVAWCRIDGSVERAKLTELYRTEELERVPAEEAGHPSAPTGWRLLTAVRSQSPGCPVRLVSMSSSL
jgi:GTP-binding protein